MTSSFQHWDPYPISITVGQGCLAHRRRRAAAARPVDGVRRDAGRATSTRVVVEHVERALHETGTLFVTPSPQATEIERALLPARFGLDMIRFTNSGTESLMYAIRAARAYTGRKAIVKIEGGYHGGYDALQVSVKPALADIGPADAPIGDVPFDVEAGTVHVVAYNDLPMLERILGAARLRGRRLGGRAGDREPRDRGARTRDTSPACGPCATSTASC